MGGRLSFVLLGQSPAPTPALTSSDILQLYASKHNPFVYFSSIQEGVQPGSNLTNTVGFDSPGGLQRHLQSGSIPTYSFIAPNHCKDQQWARHRN
jgi:hypothetical protein